MKLEQFIKEHQKEILAFERWWTKKARKEPTAFPFEMGEGDWEEQFNFFGNMNDDERSE